MAKRLAFKAATETYFMETNRGYLYKRNVPPDVAPLVGLTAWWIRLGQDKETARRKAALLRREHDAVIARLRTSAVSDLIRQEGGASAVKDALALLHMDRLIAEEAEAQGPGWRTQWRQEGMVHDLAETDSALDRAAIDGNRLAPLVEALAEAETPLASRLSDCLERWLKAPRKGGGAKAQTSQDRYYTHIRRLIEVVDDIEVTRLTKQQVRDFLDEVARLPRSNSTPGHLAKAPVPVLLRWMAMQDKAKVAALSPATVGHYLTTIVAFLSWCQRNDLVTENVAIGVEPPADPRHVDERHYAALPWREAPALFAKLSQHDSVASKALRIAILTASRINMVLGMTWSEVDGTTWTIPAARMKSKRLLRVPLSPECLTIMGNPGTDLVFPSSKRPNKRLTTSASDRLVKTYAPGFTVHGMRSTFTDWVADTRPDDGDAAEVQLAHKIGNATSQAYRRSDLLDRRRLMMQAWADFLAPSV
jgi:integrase